MSSYRLRPIVDADLPFLRQVYTSTRQTEMELIDWSEERKAQFLDMQFEAQHRHYQQHYGDAEFSIIEVEAQDAGRLYRLDTPGECRIVDISLLPAFRNRGIGSAILDRLIEEARARGASVTIHVEKSNPAMSLYRRLGFQAVRDAGVYLLMERLPAPGGAAVQCAEQGPIAAINQRSEEQHE